MPSEAGASGPASAFAGFSKNGLRACFGGHAPCRGFTGTQIASVPELRPSGAVDRASEVPAALTQHQQRPAALSGWSQPLTSSSEAHIRSVAAAGVTAADLSDLDQLRRLGLGLD